MVKPVDAVTNIEVPKKPMAAPGPAQVLKKRCAADIVAMQFILLVTLIQVT